MQCNHLSALELRHGGENCLERPPDGVPQSPHEAVANITKLQGCARSTAYFPELFLNNCLRRTTSRTDSRKCVLSSIDVSLGLKLEVRRRSIWEMIASGYPG